MKLYSYTTVVLIFFLLRGYSLYAQSEHTINFLDIKNATFTHTFKYNEKARIKIENVNRFIYKLDEEETEEEFNATVPSMLSSIKLPSFLSSQIAAPGAPTALVKANGVQPATALQIDFNKNLKALIRNWEDISEAIDKHNEAVFLSKDCENDFQTIEKKVKNVIAPVVGKPPVTSIAELAHAMESFLSGKIENSNNIVKEMETQLDAWKKKALTDYRANQTTNNDGLATLNTELSNLQKMKNPSQTQIDQKQKQIRDKESEIKDEDEDFQSAKSENEASLEKAKSLLADINKYKEDGKFFQLADDIRKVNPSNYTYYTETVVMKKDEYRFKISATAEGQLACNKPAEQKLEPVLRTKGGVKLDFSTGIFVMMGSKDFLGRSYYYKPANETQSTISATDNGNRALLGIGALMHIYKRSPASVKLGGAVGVSSTFSFDALNFHAGPSLILGDKDRFCLTFGITAREVDLLDPKYSLDQNYDKDVLPESIPTYKMFPKFGGFFSLTYNISRFNK